MAVFVLDKRGKSLMPCSEKRARQMLERGRSRVHRCKPFVIRLIDRRQEESVLQPLRIKLDPGSKATGLALVREDSDRHHVLFLAELHHRGQAIRDALAQRRAFRRRRRSANLRYRKPRFDNRCRKDGWLPPSLRHRVETTLTWVNRLRRWAPITAIGVELVRFDTQALQNPEISGVEYQQGTLAGYEVREYLLEKWGRACVYCGAKDIPLEIDHIHPRSKGGGNRVSNLTLRACNERKGSRDVSEFLGHDPKRLELLEAQRRRPLADAAAINATRWKLFTALNATGLKVEAASGGRTKYNRMRLGLPKTHALDAACVGVVDAVVDWERPLLGISCTGRGSYQRTRPDGCGFPRGCLTRRKRHYGFQTGDMV